MSSQTDTTSRLSDETSARLLDAIRPLRALARKPLDLSASDILAIAIEPVLEALGWDPRNPRQVRRGDGTLRLMASGKPAVLIQGFPFQADLPGTLPGTPDPDAEWMILSNGTEWLLFNRHAPGTPFRKISLADAASARDALDILAMLHHDGFRRDSLAEAWMAEALDENVARALIRHLDASPALVSALGETLDAEGIKVAEADIRSALMRIDLSIDGRAAEAPAPEAQGRTSAPTPPAPARRKPGRPKGSTSKTKSKSASKPAAGKTATPSTTKQPAKTASETKEKAADWPKGATHCMTRKQTQAFIRLRGKSGEVELLPGSRLTRAIGKSLVDEHKNARAAAEERGDLVVKDGLFEVTAPISFKHVNKAASFAAGTQVKDPTVWKTPSGQAMKAETNSKAAASGTTETSAKAETEAA